MTTLPQTEWQAAMAVEIKRAIERLPESMVLRPVSHSCSECGNTTVTEVLTEPLDTVFAMLTPGMLSMIDHIPVAVMGVEIEYPYRGGAVEFTVDCQLQLTPMAYRCEVVL